MNHRYGLAPYAPYNQYPTAAHPPATECLPQAGYTGRGGLFEGPTLNDVGNICGARTGTGAVVPMRAWPDVAQWQRHPVGASRGVMPIDPARTPVRFSPASLTIGFGATEPMVPQSLVNNRSVPVWTGPGVSPEGFTPRGGILDGSSIQYPSQHPSAAFYDATRPKVIGTGVQITTLPNPVNRDADVPMTSNTPAPVPMNGFGQALGPTLGQGRPEATPRAIGGGGAEVARRPRMLGRSTFGGRVYEDPGMPMVGITPPLKPMSGSPDGLGFFRGLGSLLGFH